MSSAVTLFYDGTLVYSTWKYLKVFLFISHRAFVLSDLFCLSLRHPRCSPFKGLRALLVFEKPVELWAQLMTMGGGSSVRQFQADKDDSGTGSTQWCPNNAPCLAAVLKLMRSLSRSILRHSCWQVWPRGDRPCLSAAAREKRNITGNPAGVSGVAHPESHLRGAPGFRLQASVLPRLFLVLVVLIIWPHVQNAFDQAKCWALVLLHASAVYNLILSVFMR